MKLKKLKLQVIKLMVITFGLVFTSNALASICTHNVCNKTKVKRVFLKANGETYLEIDADVANLECDVVGKSYVLVPRTSNYDTVYLTALTAKLNDLQVKVKVSMPKSDNTCNVEFLVLN